MKIIPFTLITLYLAFWLFACGENSANENSAAQPTPPVAQNIQNPPPDTPVPQYPDAETAFAEGNKFFDQNKNEMAVEAYNQAVKINPDFAEAWFKLGIAYSLIEKEKEIEAENSQEITETPTPTPRSRKSRDKKEQIIRTKDSEKAFEKAVAAYKKWLNKNPEDDLAHYNLGRTYNKLDEDEDALKSLRQAVKLKPEAIEYQIELGAILNKLAEYDESVRVLKKAVELDPDNSEAVELLEKAEAGKKRINFGITPKPPTKQQDAQPRAKETAKPTVPETDPATPEEKPKPTVQKTPEKKGNQ